MEFVTAQQVRDYLMLDGTTGRYANSVIGSNIRAASAFLQRETFRQFEAQTGATKQFTSNGRAQVPVPDLRSVTSVTLQDTAMDPSEYYLIPDTRHSGVYVAVQVRTFSGGDYRSNPSWFDRNLDRDWLRGSYSSLPNDLVITGDWGWDPLPEQLLHATKVLAAWYTKRPDSVLANIAVTPEGTELRYSDVPPEVRDFISSWALTELMVMI